jgi:hypothetical protein
MSTYSPIPGANGFGSFAEAAETGWHQLPVPGATLPTITGITVPGEAQGMLIQATTGVRYMFSPTEALAGATTYLEIPAGGTLFLPGYTWITKLCILLGNGAEFSIQFTVGSIGPIPELSATSSSGPPPTPGITSIPIENTVHVMKNGDDGTGERNRLDLPFLTIGAAKAALQPGDTMCIWPGTYAEGGIDVIDVTYLLLGADIIGPSDAVATFDFTGEGNVIISGAGNIGHAHNDEVFYYTIRCSGSDVGHLRINGPTVRQVNGYALAVLDAWKADVRCDVYATGDALCVTGNVNGTGTIYGAGTGAISATDGQVQIWTGNVFGGVNAASGSRQDIYGDISTVTTVSCNAATQTIHGNIFGDADNVLGVGLVVSNSGVQTLYGNIDCLNGASCDDSQQYIHGNVTATDGSGDEGAVHLISGTQVVVGDVLATAKRGVTILDGVQTIRGNIQANNNSDDPLFPVAVCSGGLQYLYGNLSGSSLLGALCEDGYQYIFGNMNFSQLAVCAGGQQHLNGICESPGRIDVSGGLCFINGAIVNTASNACVQLFDGATLYLRGSAVFETGGAETISAVGTGTGRLVSLGAYGNQPINPALTVDGDFNVL